MSSVAGVKLDSSVMVGKINSDCNGVDTFTHTLCLNARSEGEALGFFYSNLINPG